MSSNSEQLYFINKTSKNMKLIGIPGGGKTRTIIEKIIYMKKIGEIKTNHDFLILTFSRKSREDFLVKGQEKDKNGLKDFNELILLIYSFKSNFKLKSLDIVDSIVLIIFSILSYENENVLF